MGYLICDKCKGYYELLPGEKPEDFTDICLCGGKLRYMMTIEVDNNENPHEPKGKNEQNDNKKNYLSYPKRNHEIDSKTKSCTNCGSEIIDKPRSNQPPFKITFLGLIGLIFFTGVFIFILGQIDSTFGSNHLTFILWISLSIVLIFQYLINRK